MQALVGIGMAVFVLTCAAVGIKLISLAIRGGGLALWCCGLAFSLIAFLGYPLPVVAGLGQVTVAELNMPLLLIGNVSSSAGICLFFVFTAHVFHSGQAWARGLCGVLVATYAGVTVANSIALLNAPPELASYDVNWSYGLAIQVLCVICFAWMAGAGLHQWRMSCRRLALGLGDPVVSNRFLMWGLFGASAGALVVVLIVLQLQRVNAGTDLVGSLAMAGFGLVSSVFAALAFFPPRAYLDRVRSAVA